MNGTVDNEWITLTEKRKGVTVQRKYAGESNAVRWEDNSVEHCTIYYWEQELYPNGEPIATVKKCYHLTNLPEDITETYKCLAMPVLDGFIFQLGQPAIIDPARETLIGAISLPVDAPDDYPLHRDTREKLPL